MVKPSEVRKVKLLLAYHRNVADLHRGQGIYINRFLSSLSQHFDIYVVDASGYFEFWSPGNNSHVTSTFIGDLRKSFINFLRWVILRRGRKNYVILSEDLYISVFVIPLAVILRIPPVYRSSDFGIQYRKLLMERVGIKFRILPLLLNLSEKIICNISKMVIVPSEDERMAMINSGISSGKIFVYPYHPVKAVCSEQDIMAFKDSLGLVGKLIITFVGNMEYKPNAEAALFIVTLAEMHRKNFPDDEAIYLIAGKGSEKLAKHSADNLRVVGELENIQVLLNASDIGLNPSMVPGGSSIKVIDYLVNGLLVISTREGSHGVVENERMMICSREEFLERIRLVEQIIRFRSFNRESIPSEITEYYMTDKWSRNIIKSIEKLNGMRLSKVRDSK